MKAVGTVDSGPTAITESTTKPPPFKDPTFMVSVCDHVDFKFICFCYLLFNHPAIFSSLNLASTPGSVEQPQVKRTGPGRISNRFWFWSGRYPGSSMIRTVSFCILLLCSLQYTAYQSAIILHKTAVTSNPHLYKKCP